MIGIILSLGLILRLWNLGQSLWLDEGAQVIDSSYSLRLIAPNMAGDFHAPLFHYLFHFWLYLGRAEVVMRMLPVLLGLASIYLTYLIAKEVLSSKVALLASLILAINPFHIYLSQELRPYMSSCFFALLQIFLLLRAINKGGKNWWTFFVATVLNFYSSYFAIFISVSELMVLIVHKRSALRSFLISHLIAGILFIPWLPITFRQLQISQGISHDLPGWKDVVATPVLKALPLTLTKFIMGQVSFYPKIIYQAVALSLIGGWILIIAKGVEFKNKNYLRLFLLSTGSLLLPIIFSIFLQIAAPKRLIFVLPLVVILLAGGIAKFKNWQRRIALVLVSGVSLVCLGFYEFNPSFQREDWRAAVSKVDNLADSNSVIVFKFTGIFAPYLYYEKKDIRILPVAQNLQVSESSLEQKLNLVNINKVFVYQYLGGLTDSNHLVEKRLTMLNFRKRDTFDFSGVGLVDFYQR